MEYLAALALECYPVQKIFLFFAMGALTTSIYLQLSVGQGRKQRFFSGQAGKGLNVAPRIPRYDTR